MNSRAAGKKGSLLRVFYCRRAAHTLWHGGEGMRVLLAGLMTLLLLRPGTAMTAVSESCRLFVTAVMPGLLPYMVLSAMLLSRCGGRVPLWGLTLLGWCGGSPSGARLLELQHGLSRRQRVFISVATSTMSPMFLLGTCGAWLGSSLAGAALLAGVLTGGGMAGALAARCMSEKEAAAADAAQGRPLSFGEAVEQAARTLLMVCGTMAMWRMLAALAAEICPAVALPVTTLLEVTSGAQQISCLPLPLSWRTALLAAATGFGGAAILMQNRAVQAAPALPFALQLLWQGVHAVISGLVTLGLMLLLGAMG